MCVFVTALFTIVKHWNQPNNQQMDYVCMCMYVHAHTHTHIRVRMYIYSSALKKSKIKIFPEKWMV